jgi:small subunit ribosomal protein S6
MRIYEEVYIAKPSATEEEINALNDQLDSVVKVGGGKTEKVDRWGVRKLAYRVDKNQEGFFVVLLLHCGAQVIREVERRLRVSDLVIKHQTVRMDETLRWIERRKKAREKRAARKPPPLAAPPALPAAAPAVPGAPAAAAEAVVMPGAPAAEPKSE